MRTLECHRVARVDHFLKGRSESTLPEAAAKRDCVGIAGAEENFVNLCLFALSPIPDKLFLEMTRLRTIIGHILKEGEGS